MKKQVTFAVLLTALMTTSSPLPARASDDAAIARMEARIDALEKEVAELKSEKQAAAPAQELSQNTPPAVSSASAPSAAAARSIDEGKWMAAIAPSAGGGAAANTSDVTVKLDNTGLSVKNAGNDTLMRIHGFVQGDARFFLADHDHNANDTFELRHARLIIEGGAHGFFYNLTPEFSTSGSTLLDAYAGYGYKDAFALQMGKMKPPLGLDQLQGTTDLRFTENGLPALLVPSRDAGVLAFGALNDPYFETKLIWQLGVFNNVPDNVNDNADHDDGKAGLARLFAEYGGAGIGAAGTFGSTHGSTATPLLPSFTTAGRQTFFSYAAGSFADGRTWRANPQAYFYHGPFGAMADYTFSGQRVSNGAVSEDILNRAWGVQAEWVLTGENATYKSVVPDHPFDPDAGNWGAWELDGRIGRIDIDDSAFPVLAGSATAAGSATNWGIGLSGFLNSNARVLFSYEQTSFDGGKTGGADRETEKALFGRAQYQF